MEYFMVNPDTGHISLKKSVVLDPERRTAYTVQISARDRGEPTTKAATNRSATTALLAVSVNKHLNVRCTQTSLITQLIFQVLRPTY